jgi:hypothetical protein
MLGDCGQLTSLPKPPITALTRPSAKSYAGTLQHIARRREVKLSVEPNNGECVRTSCLDAEEGRR